MLYQDQIALDFEKPHFLLTPDELFQQNDPALLKALLEDRRIERKAPAVDPRILAEYFSMWSNTPPFGGLLVLGMANDGTIVGCKDVPHSRLMKLELAAQEHCPDAKYRDRRLPTKNCRNEEDFLLVFRVYYHETKVVATVKGNAYRRVGDTKRKLRPTEVRELEIDKGQLDLELEPAPFKYPIDFDEELLRSFARSWMSSRNITGRTIRDILALNDLGVNQNDEFLPNTACALLFAKAPQRHYPGAYIRFLRFDGEEEGTGEQWNAVKDVWIDQGSVPRLIRDASVLLAGQLRTFSRLSPDGKFYTAPEYPTDAWQEAIVNACVHRSYGLKNIPIYLKMFDDRLEVESPGGFPPMVTPENIFETHSPRNPRLMRALYFLEFVKCAHEGTRRMRARMLEMKLPQPEFTERQTNHTSVRVTLRNNKKQRKVWIDSEVRDIVSATLAASLSTHEKRAVNFVAEHGSINVSQMQRLTGHGWVKSKAMLLALVKKGILEHHIRSVSGKGRDSKAHFSLRRP